MYSAKQAKRRLSQGAPEKSATNEPKSFLESNWIGSAVADFAARPIGQYEFPSTPSLGCCMAIASDQGQVVIGVIPARRWWDVQWWKEHWPEIAFPKNGNPLTALFDYVLTYVQQQPVFVIRAITSRRVGSGRTGGAIILA